MYEPASLPANCQLSDHVSEICTSTSRRREIEGGTGDAGRSRQQRARSSCDGYYVGYYVGHANWLLGGMNLA